MASVVAALDASIAHPWAKYSRRISEDVILQSREMEAVFQWSTRRKYQKEWNMIIWDVSLYKGVIWLNERRNKETLFVGIH